MGARSRCSQWISPSQIRDLASSIKSTSYGHGSLVCGLWLAGGGRGRSVPTYILGTHSTYILLVIRATKDGKIVNPAVRLVEPGTTQVGGSRSI